MLQLKRFEHEGDWSRALLSYDLVLQHLLGGPVGGPASGTQRQQQQQALASQLPGTDPNGAFGSQFPASQAAGGLASRAAAPAGFEGISQQAAVAGLLRSLAHLGAAHLLQAYSRSPEVPEAAAQAALSLGQWGQLGSSPTSSGGGSGLSLDAALSAAVAGLQAGSMERCKQAVSGARRGLVASLVTASLEGAANVNPSLVQLQMLQAVSEAWELLWPALPDLGSIGSPKKRRRRPASNDGTAAAAAAAVAAAAGGGPSPLLEGVLQLWQGREAAAGAGGRYDLQAPLQVRSEGGGSRCTWQQRSSEVVVQLAQGGDTWCSLLRPHPCRACTSSCWVCWAPPTSRPPPLCALLCLPARQVGGLLGWGADACLAASSSLITHHADQSDCGPACTDLPVMSVRLPRHRQLCPGHHQPVQAAWPAAAGGRAGRGRLPRLGAGHVGTRRQLARGRGQAAVGAGPAGHGGAAGAQPVGGQVRNTQGVDWGRRAVLGIRCALL